MNDSLLPESLDARKIFNREAVVQGQWPVSKMPRFCGLLADESGVTDVDLRFQLDEQHRRRISGSVSVQVHVICQRCLEVMTVSIHENLQLALVASEAIGLRLPEEIDPWISDSDQLALLELVEEQLILGLPVVNRHQDCAAVTMPAQDNEEQGSAEGERDNPFAALAALKKDRD